MKLKKGWAQVEDVQENGRGPGKHADGDSDWVAIQVVGQEGMIRSSGGGVEMIKGCYWV